MAANYTITTGRHRNGKHWSRATLFNNSGAVVTVGGVGDNPDDAIEGLESALYDLADVATNCADDLMSKRAERGIRA